MPDSYQFGSIEIDPARRRLLVDGRQAPIGQRAFDVLMVLINHAGAIVSKSQLLDLAWPDVIVEENNLQVQISALRKALGPQAIATIPGRGYQWSLAPQADASLPVTAMEARSTDDVGGNVSVHHSSGVARFNASPLYGRDEDLVALGTMVRQHKLVTLVGPAGIGKTRLAQAAASIWHNDFADDACMLEIASLMDPAVLMDTLARALGVAVNDPATAPELVARAVANRDLLLVLDNCEHLVGAVNQLVTALRKHAPRLHMLVTSQEVLKHPDEQLFRLSALGLPKDNRVAPAETSGAVQLFVARARAVNPRFDLNQSNVDAIVDIVTHLDGIPLAIELAAARLSLLGVDGIRERLSERFRLLTAGSRLALPRHQTLRAALDWSYGLLAPPERELLDQLGIFTGGFSLDAAQQLAAMDGNDQWTVLDQLSALIDKSLVMADNGSTPRYRLLETTRAFAIEHLAARGETARVLQRHAEAVLTLFERFYDQNLLGAPVGPHVKRLLPDLDNLRAALHWCTGPDGDKNIAIALVGAVGAGRGFWTNAGFQNEGWHWCEQVKPFLDASADNATAARFWLACAEQGTPISLSASIVDTQRAIDLYDRTDDKIGRFLAWDALAYANALSGQPASAAAAIDKSHALIDPTWPLRLRAIHENTAGLHYSMAGELDLAREHFLSYRSLSRQMGSDSDVLTATCLLSDVEVAAGHFERALEIMLQEQPLLESGTEYDRGIWFRNYATAALHAGRLEEAEIAYRDALPLIKVAFGNSVWVLSDASLLVALQGKLDDAARVAAYAHHVNSKIGRKMRPVTAQIQSRLRKLLVKEFSADGLGELERQGRALTDEQACNLAFSPETIA